MKEQNCTRVKFEGKLYYDQGQLRKALGLKKLPVFSDEIGCTSEINEQVYTGGDHDCLCPVNFKNLEGFKATLNEEDDWEFEIERL